MTEEQIKQNAWNDLGRYSSCDENEWIDGYVVGAHSRDEEIENLKRIIEEKEKEIIKLRDNNKR